MFDGASKSAYTFQRETFAGVIDEGRAMLAWQWTEAGETGAGEFRLSEDRYLAVDKAGGLRIFTVRHNGALIGYATLFVFFGMHAAAKAAISDALYILPEFRRPGVSMRLVRFAERSLRAEVVDVIHMSVNDRFPGFGRLLEHMGYHPISRTLTKVLRHAP